MSRMPRAVRLSIPALVAAVALSGGLAAPAGAASFDLGTITESVSLPIARDQLLGAFTDTYSFSIGAGDTFDVEALIDTGFQRRASIPDLAGSLFTAGGSLLQLGDAQTRYMPEGWAAHSVSFASMLLGTGAYKLVLTGTGTSVFPDIPISSLYFGHVDFTAATAPVPEPEIAALFAVGLAFVAAVLRRRRAGAAPSGAAPDEFGV